MSKKQVIAKSGKIFYVDISDDACCKFGFKHRDRIQCLFGAGTVVGVAPATAILDPNLNVLWYELDRDNGRASYSYPQNIQASTT